jgi:hypothetical protein
MPCLMSIEMSDNQIGGDVLTCLIEIPTLDKIDMSGNIFGRPSNDSTNAVTSRASIASSAP